MYSTLFYTACLFLIFIGGCWSFECLFVKSELKEKLVKIFDLVSWNIGCIYGFFHQKRYHQQKLIPLEIYMELNTHTWYWFLLETLTGCLYKPLLVIFSFICRFRRRTWTWRMSMTTSIAFEIVHIFLHILSHFMRWQSKIIWKERGLFHECRCFLS